MNEEWIGYVDGAGSIGPGSSYQIKVPREGKGSAGKGPAR